VCNRDVGHGYKKCPHYINTAEIIEEYRKKVNRKMEKYTIFGREYIQRIMREVAKEMKGGAE
jgi:Fe-S oxidoreductase